MNRLIAYLRQNLMLDIQGDLSLEMIREFLKDDDSRDAKQLLARVVADGGVDDMMLVLADCLMGVVQERLSDEDVHDNLRMYSES